MHVYMFTYIHNKYIYSRLNDVVVKEIKQPLDIAAWSIARCLYVSDDKERCVW